MVLFWIKYYSYPTNPLLDNSQRMLSLNKTSDNGFVTAIEQLYTNPNRF